MRINHLIVGVDDLVVSSKFFVSLLGFNVEGGFTDTLNQQEGKVLGIKDSLGNSLQLLLVKYPSERLPNPRHYAFEVNSQDFDLIYEKARSMGLKTRADSPRDCPVEGIGQCEAGGFRYRNFFVFDPTGSNLEIMAKI